MIGGAINDRKLLLTCNISLSLIVGFYNLIDQILKGQSLLLRSYYTIPFLIIAILIYITRKKLKYLAYIYSVVSIIILAGSSTAGNLTGLIFLWSSLFIFQTKKSNLILILITLIIIPLKLFMNFSAMQVLLLFMGYAYGVLIYYNIFHPKSPSMVYNPKIDEENSQILELLASGKTNKEIADKVYLTQNAVTKRLKTMRDNFEVKSNCQLIHILTKKGYFRHD